ncbi:MAG: entericidin A/B family lipoprotein [Phycisphaeraceae bacterium]|nr:entericidin A/B family lipoprotein [Phycisphaeraceae bacterium]
MLFLCSCNTTEGFGKDVKSLGNGIEQSAQDAKD